MKLPKVPDIIPPIADVKVDFSTRPSLAKEMKPPDLITPFSQPLVNGIETNPAMISNLLKEAPTVPHLPVAVAAIAPPPATLEKAEHHHKSEKKKKKEKHKHKDKSKSKEDKEKKKKHKDKDREKHKSKGDKAAMEEGTAAPIKITIPKDKITNPDGAAPGLKIKIPRDKFKTDNGSDLSSSTGASLLKIKISKDQISGGFSGIESRKRDRDKSSPVVGAPPAKASKSNYGRSSVGGELRQNGRSSYTKVSNYRPLRAPPPNNVIPRMMGPGYHPPPLPRQSRPYFYPNFPPPPVAMSSVPPPPPSMQVPPPPFMYPADAQMFSHQFYPGYQMFHAHAPPQEMYQMVGSDAPPLPEGPPPNNPPPPPE